MAARALASASIAFGLVSIPVKLFAAVDSTHAVRFNQIHSKDGSRIKHQTVSAKTGEPVPRGEIVKGYEFAKDQYVLFSPEELKALEAAADQTIDVVEFIDATTVDHLMVDKAYYLGPDKGGARAYSLLAAALRKTGRAAIARYAARGRQHLVMVRPFEDGLLLEQLHYAQELRRFSDLEVETSEVRDGELALAVQLIEQSASEQFEPDKYRDEVRERMLELIQRKVDGEDISVSPAEHADDKIIDIMEALKASIATRDGESAQERKPASKSASAKKTTGKKKAKARTATSSSGGTRRRKAASGDT